MSTDVGEVESESGASSGKDAQRRRIRGCVEAEDTAGGVNWPLPTRRMFVDAGLAFRAVINERIADLLDGDRAITVRSRRGRPILRLGLAPAFAAGTAAILFAPRATAAVAVGAMFRGLRLTIDYVDPAPEADAA